MTMIDEVRSEAQLLSHEYLIRVGQIAETLRCFAETDVELNRGDQIAVQTDRGLRFASVLNRLSSEPLAVEDDELPSRFVRRLSDDDQKRLTELREQADRDFPRWQQRIAQWKVAVELLDLEWTLDGERVMLYVLNERGPECTKLALMAAAAGLGIIEVVPVSPDGQRQPTSSGSGGCGSGGCSK
ncbi:hypothetical protein [Rubinisphaera margarita]|uniref:hypothetical protein n=1 Tax=Rubinisphaera margarita TaxID=2909586 RepID=UPI001EE98C3E|nr:hypothetical protein [Rubinisphaera margarita]MCG6157071.1 hypothetical protein [Rubinisphaera margarita]